MKRVADFFSGMSELESVSVAGMMYIYACNVRLTIIMNYKSEM